MSPIIPVGAQVTGDASGFVGAMGTAIRGLTSFAGAAGLATTAMGAFAGAIALGAAIGAARDFQAELVKLNTLVGIQTEQIEEWEGSLKDLAVQTGQAPTDLAKAMFAITSGGARGSQALEILEASAKASAIGLGDMTALGRTAGAMLQAFGSQGLTAQKAIDVLTATVRAGNLEADSLAGAFSRVLGPAAALGSSVEDIGAFMATFTRLGGDTANAATGLLNIFTLLIKPPDEARKKMEELGISLEDIRATVAEDGLTPALLQMKDALGDNVDALGKVLPNVRGLIAFLSTAGLQGEAFAEIQGQIEDSLGLTEEGFITWGDSADAAFKQFGAQAQVIGIEVGANLLPPLAAILRIMIPLSDVLRTAAEGWDLIFQAIEKGGGTLVELGKFFGIVEEDFESAALAAERLAASVEVASMDRLEQNMQGASNALRATRAQLAEVQEALEGTSRVQRANVPHIQALVAEELRLRNVAEQQSEVLSANVAAHVARRIAIAETADAEVIATAEASLLTDEQIKQREAIEDIIAGLKQEVRALEEGEFANIEYRLEQQLATAADIERARVQFDLAQMLRDTAAAEREAEQEAERARVAKERESKREEDRRAKAVKDAADAARKLAEDTRLAELNDQMRQITEESRQMAETVGQAFSDMADGTKSVTEAFATMVTEILKQLQRLVIQETIIRPLMGFLIGQFAPGGGSGGGSGGGNDFGLPQFDGGGANQGGFFSENVFSGAPNAQQGNVIQQNITFSPSLIDGASGARFIQQHSGEITGIIADGARNSGQLSAAFSGQNQ